MRDLTTSSQSATVPGLSRSIGDLMIRQKRQPRRNCALSEQSEAKSVNACVSFCYRIAIDTCELPPDAEGCFPGMALVKRLCTTSVAFGALSFGGLEIELQSELDLPVSTEADASFHRAGHDTEGAAGDTLGEGLSRLDRERALGIAIRI